MGSAAAGISGGSKGGGGSSGGGYSSIIDAINQAAALSAQFDQKAVDSLNQYYQQAQQQYQQYYSVANTDIQNANQQSQAILAGGINQGTQALLSGQQQAGAYLAPYINAGLPALDAYSQSLGLGTPVGGSLAAFNQQQAAAQAQQNTNMAAGDQYNQQLAAYNQQQNTYQNGINAFTASGGTGVGAPLPTGVNAQTTGSNQGYVYDPTTGIATKAATTATGVSDLQSMAMSIAQKWNPQAVNSINSWVQSGDTTSLANFIQGAISSGSSSKYSEDNQFASSLQSQLSSLKYSPTTAAATQNLGIAPTAPNQANYLPAQTAIAAAPAMTSNADAATTGLTNFYNSPEYQALYGNGQSGAQLAGQTTAQNFQQDPGYQFQLQQGAAAIQNSAFAHGSGYSPAMAQALQTYGTGLANQSFDTYRTGLSNTFTQYQNQLAGLATSGQTAAGAGATLAQNTATGINNNATGLATGQANLNAAAGQAQSNNAMNAAAGTSAISTGQGNAMANIYTGEGQTQANAAIAAGQAEASQSQYQNSAGAAGLGQLTQGLGAVSSLFGSSSGSSGSSGTSSLGTSSGATSGSSGGGGGLQGAGSGAAQGAAAGSMFGPYGTAIGAVGGGLLGYFSGK